MKRSVHSRLLSFLLALAMVFSMLPVSALAAEDSATYRQITTAEELVSGQYVMTVSTGYAPTTLDGSWILAESVTAADGAVTDPAANQVWTLTVDGTNVKLTDSNGVTVKPKGGNNNGIASGDYSWAVTCTDGTFQFSGQGDDTVVLASNVAQANKFRAYKSATVSGNPNGYPSFFTLYKLEEGGSTEPSKPTEPTPSDPSEPSEPVTPALPFADGDDVVIYVPAYGKALSATKTGNYNVGMDVTVTDGVMTGYTAAEVWTVAVNEDGTVSFANGGKNIGLGDSYSSMNLDAVYDDWKLFDLGGGLYNVQNVGRGNYMEWYAQYSNWSTYNSSSAATDDQYQIAFYMVPEGGIPEPAPTDPEPSDPSEPSEPEEPEVEYAEKMTELPKDGDTILIYNSGNALGSAASGKKLAGVAAEVTDSKLPILDGMAQLLVTIDESGNYIFTLDGQYMTSAETGNGLSFAAELTDCGKWTMEAATDGTWYIKNVGANYNGNYNQALEYYSGFTTYGIKETAIYQMELFLVEAAPVYPIPDGDYVIWVPAYNMALSSVYSGFYNTGVAVTEADGKLSGYTAAEVWTVTNNGDDTISISFDGQKLAMAASYSSMTLGEVNDKWVAVDAGNGLFYIKNQARGAYIEWYADKNNWSGYGTIGSGKEGMFALKFTPAKAEDIVETTLPAAGDQVVIYNLNAEGVLAAENDTESIENAPARIVDGKAVPANGGVVFTVEVNGNYYRFRNETYGYLCSYGTGNNAVYRAEASEDADWTLEPLNGGYKMLSRTAKYNGTSPQYLEYYADSYKTYSFYATNKDGSAADTSIYEFYFYGVAENVNLTGGIVNSPDVVFVSNPTAYLGQDYAASFQVDAVFGVETMTVTATAGDVSYTLEPTLELDTYTVTLTAGQIAALHEASLATGLPSAIFALSISGTDTKGVDFANGGAIDIVDEPGIGDVTPAPNSQTNADRKPVISAAVSNAGEGATVTMTVNGEAVEAVYADGVITYTPAEDMAEGRTTVTVTVARADGKTAEKTWSFTVGVAKFQLYFGQLHSHTTYSDGSGSLETALEYIASLPESANVDFVAFTDHSNYFDASGAANPEGALYDLSLATASSQTKWAEYTGAARSFNAKQSEVLALPGFEMTWSGGPGHMNTFNTPGIVSRNNTTLNNKTADAGMKAYYALLSQAAGADSINQFNHPGSTFGTFSDFAYWDALIDSRIQLVEVGNGEGQIGAGGYYPSYEYYTMALDKGWHVAPTNNQDNHKGKWGNANDARDVILTDDFTEEGLYAAIRAMRVYATEDKNLEIGYTVNGMLLGSTISEVPEKLTLDVTVYDPDASDSISKVEVIVNSGKVAHTWSDPADLADGALTVTLDPSYSYYYIRVTEGDGDLAVTAPVWVGEMLKLGISSVETATSTPVTNEELTITTTLFNSEATDATVKTLVYTVGDQVIGTDNTGYTVGASSSATVDFKYTPTAARMTTVTVTAIMEQDGTEYTFTMDITLDVQDAGKLVYIGIDASHYNEYVNGNYKDSMGNFSQLAAEYNVRTVTLYESSDLIEACGNDKYVALILTAPSRRLAAAQADPKVYTAEEIAAIKAFNEKGGTVILAGWSDNYENYDVIQNDTSILHMAAAQNAVLEALGSSLRIGDDATYDDVRSAADGVDKWRLYFNTYGDSFLTAGVEVDPEHPYDRMYTEVFSHYGGATVYTVPSALPATVSPVVYAHSSTYSVDVDKDGLGGSDIPKYTYAEGDERLMVMASEQLEGRGLIVVSGAAFMSNFEVQATIEDSGSEKNYSNYKVCENLLNYLNPVAVSTIAEVRAQTEAGYKYTIEGIVTSNASGYDKDTAFFDCIYVQDATGGICCFPVAGNYKIGDKVRITGTTEFYQGEPELQVTSIEVIGEGTVEPTEVTAAQINDRSAEGRLVKISGTVESFELANGLVQTIMVRDAAGNVARIFIDGYITISEDVKDLAVGAGITAVGLASYDDTFNAPEGPFPRIRIRSRADIVCTAPAECDHDFENGYCQKCGEPDPDYEAPVDPSSPEECDHDFENGYCQKCGEPDPNYEAPVDPSSPEECDHSYKDGYCQICGEPDPNYEPPVDPSSPTEPEDPDEPGKPTVEGLIRVAGDNRIGTSLKLADQLKETLGVEKFEAVVVASAMNFPDALTGSYLANAKNAPILLTTKGFEDEVNAYIKANLADGGTVYVLGGEKAVPSELLTGISGVKRVAGDDRFGTNLAILKETGVSAEQPILIATALNFADSLSASATGLPMLLVYGKLTAEQKAFLATTSKKFIIVGGENAVSVDLEAELKAIGSVERLAGAGRYETSVMVAEKFIADPDDVVLAYARNFPDGLCGGPLAYALGAPLILTDNNGPAAADQYVDGISAGIVVGGEGLISDGVARAIFDLTADTGIELY